MHGLNDIFDGNAKPGKSKYYTRFREVIQIFSVQ